MAAIFLMFLPALMAFGLLLLLAGAVQLALLLRVLALGLYRGAIALWRSSLRRSRTVLDKLHGGRGGGQIVPH
jgi:hypothetical protein